MISKTIFRNGLAVIVILLTTNAITSGKSEPIRVACVGDSITQGYPAAEIEAWPAVLGKMLGPAYDVMNFGAGGTTMLKNGSLPYCKPETYKKFGETNGYNKAIDSKPDIVIIALGTNDCMPQNFGAHAAEFEPDTESLIDSFRSLPTHPRVILALPPPIVDGGNYGITEDDLTKGVLPALRHVATKNSIEVIDIFDFMLPHPDQFWDNVHPNVQGYASLARCVYFFLTRAPVVDPFSPVFIKSDRVTIIPNPAADYTVYTTGGSEPSLNSMRYTAPLELNESCIIKARSVEHGKLSTFVARAEVKKVEPDPPADVASLKPGVWEAAYNSDPQYVISNFEKLTNPTISVNSQFALPKPTPAGTVLDFKGYINIPVTDLYTFTTTTSMGSRLYIDGKEVLSSWQFRLLRAPKTGHIALAAGYHPIRLEFFCGGGVPELTAAWANSAIQTQEIPASALFHSDLK